MAGKLGRAGIQLLVVDTESRYMRSTASTAPAGAAAHEGLASEMARAAGGRYYHLPMVAEPRAASENLSKIVHQ